MSRFYGTGVNGRGNTVSFGGQQNAGEMHLRGWDAGVKVVPIGIKGQPDVFRIYMTGGSHAATGDQLIGEVKQTPNGPVFEPAFDPNGFLDNARLQA